MSKTKIINTVKSELVTALNVEKIKSLISKICKDEFNRAVSSNTMEIDTIIENLRFGWQPPDDYTAIIETYQKIFGKNVFKIDYAKATSNRNLFKKSIANQKGPDPIKIPRQGIYTKRLDQKTFIIVITTNSVLNVLDSEDDMISTVDINITQIIIGGNRKKWKSRIIELNDKNVEKIQSKFIKPSLVKEDKEIPHSPVIPIKNILSNNEVVTIKRKVSPMENIVFPKKDEILEKIENFMNGEELYYKTSIPYKIGILLHGVHGTGKTSFALALAHKYNIPISYLDLSFFDSDNPDLGTLDSMLMPLPQRQMYVGVVDSYRYCQMFSQPDKSEYRIILIDEIDAQLSSNEMDVETDKSTKIVAKRLLRLLNALDSIGNGAIVIATTNHIECLTPKLIRSGRFDYIYELENLDKSDCYEMLKTRGIDDPEKLLKDKTFPYNPSELEQDLISYIIKEHQLCNTHKIDIKELMGDEMSDLEMDDGSKLSKFSNSSSENKNISSMSFYYDDTDI